MGVGRPARRNAPWFLWPFAALWDLLAFILRLTGRLIGIVVGLLLLGLGIALSLTVIGMRDSDSAPPAMTTSA